MNTQVNTLEEAQALIAKLSQQLASKSTKQQPGDAFVSEKGLICMVRGKNPTTGKGQWPVSMYASDWALVFENQDKIKAVIQGQLNG